MRHNLDSPKDAFENLLARQSPINDRLRTVLLLNNQFTIKAVRGNSLLTSATVMFLRCPQLSRLDWDNGLRRRDPLSRQATVPNLRALSLSADWIHGPLEMKVALALLKQGVRSSCTTRSALLVDCSNLVSLRLQEAAVRLVGALRFPHYRQLEKLVIDSPRELLEVTGELSVALPLLHELKSFTFIFHSRSRMGSKTPAPDLSAFMWSLPASCRDLTIEYDASSGATAEDRCCERIPSDASGFHAARVRLRSSNLLGCPKSHNWTR